MVFKERGEKRTEDEVEEKKVCGDEREREIQERIQDWVLLCRREREEETFGDSIHQHECP